MYFESYARTHVVESLKHFTKIILWEHRCEHKMVFKTGK